MTGGTYALPGRGTRPRRGRQRLAHLRGRRARQPHANHVPGGRGFFDRGFGHVHRAVAGVDGADFYLVFVLASGSETHLIPGTAPEECTAGSDSGDDPDERDDHTDDGG
jgi:hypothetical protein